MTVNISLVQPGAAGSVPRVCAPFAPVPQSSVPRVGPPPPPPPDERLPVMTVGGARPDRTGNVDLAPFLAGFVSHVGDSSIHHTALEIGQIAAGKVAEVVDGAPAALDTLKEIADVIGTETGQAAAGILKRVADLESGKADKGEMSVTPVAGSLDKTTIQLKSGTSATVLTAHQDISGKVDKNETTVVAGLGATATGDGAVAVGPVRANGQGAGAFAEGNASVALGYWSRATAFGAVQVGYGVNSTQNSFQFRAANLFVESDGAVRLGAGFPAATTTAPGSMSAADKAKLNGIAAGATAVTVDSALSQTSENPVQNKVVAKALHTGFTEWEFSGSGYDPAHEYEIPSPSQEGNQWDFYISKDGEFIDDVYSDTDTPTSLTFSVANVTATRHLITPTKTSQLTNDGPSSGPNVGHPFATTNQIPAPVDISGKLDGAAAFPKWEEAGLYASGSICSYNGKLYRVKASVSGTAYTPPDQSSDWEVVIIKLLLAAKQDALSSQQIGYINAVPNKADKAVPSSAGNLAALNAQGNLADSGVKPSDLAAKADLPYALVTPGEWEFSELPSGYSDPVCEWNSSESVMLLTMQYEGDDFEIGNYDVTQDSLSVTFAWDEGPGTETYTVTATRPFLPGHLLDRAVNAVPVSSATEITLPNKIAGGKSRDFYVRLSVSAESAVTFAAIDSGGDAVSWDSMGSPSGTLAAGTYLYRFTEVADGVFHAADITDGGSIDPAVLDEKLDASSAAPAFSESLTYLVGEYVTYGGILYRCKTAVTTAGAWTGTSNWEADDMTSPDATLDIMSDGRLRVVTVAGEDLWMQGYDLESTSAQVLKCEKVNLLKFPATTAEAFDSTAAYAVGDSVVYGGMVYKFTAAHSAGDWVGTDAAVDSVSLTMPYVSVGKVGDFVLDVDNSANASVKMVAELSGLFTAFDVFVDKGRNLSDLLTFDGGEQCELYFTMTAFGTQAKPAWKVVKQVVEKQEAGS